MDEKLKTQKYLKLCQTQWRWILDNYDRLIEGGCEDVWDLKGAYFDECGLDGPKLGHYLCELTDFTCLKCPLSGIAWRKDHNYPCENDEASMYLRILYLLGDSRYEEAKDVIKELLSIIDNECRLR